MKAQSFSIEDIEKVYISLTNSKTNLQPQQFKQHLNQISRMIIWGDQNQSDIFDFVCEVKMLDSLLEIFSKSKDKEVINTVIGFFTTLLTNLAKQSAVNYLLSHPCIASLMLTKFGNMNNEVADYYINFLKVLSRKVTAQNLHIFFNRRYPNFPLLTQSVRFFNNPESLVRTTSRNIILSISKLKQAKIDNFMAGFPFVCYYIHECNFIKEYWTIIDAILHSQEDNKYELDNLDILVQDHEEILIFIDDFLSLNQAGVEDKFCDAFINECLSPLAIALDSQLKEGFSIKIILFVLGMLLKNLNSQLILDTIALMIFGKYYTTDLMNCMFSPVDRLMSYDKKWKFKGFWDSHEDKITNYCMQCYHEDASLESSKKEEESWLMASITKKIDTFSVFGVTNNFYEKEVEKIQSIFGIPIISKDLLRPSTPVMIIGGSTVIKSMLQEINSEIGLNLSKCEVNPLSEAIQSYLISKDDSLMMLTLDLFGVFVSNSKVSKSVANFCKLSVQPKGNDFESVIKIEKTIINCIRVFQVDPPCYRICTYMQAQQLVKKLSCLYELPELALSSDIIDSLKRGLRIVIDRITPYLYGGKQWQKSLQIYLDIQKKGNKRRAKTLQTYGLVPADQNIDPNKSLIEVVYDHFPRDFNHQITRDFWIYVLMRDLFLLVNQKHFFAHVELPPVQGTTSKYEEGKSYTAIDQQTISAEYKATNQQKYSGCEIILLSGYFVLLKSNCVELKSKYQDVFIFPDKSDPRKLMLKHEEGMMSLNLFQAKLAMALKKHIEDSKSLMLRYRLAQMVKQIQALGIHC